MKNGQKYKDLIDIYTRETGLSYACGVRSLMHNVFKLDDCLDYGEGHGACNRCMANSCEWVNSECKEDSIVCLTEKEKKIIMLMVTILSYFSCEILFVDRDCDYLYVTFKDSDGIENHINTPFLGITGLFDSMKIGNKYTVKELGL